MLKSTTRRRYIQNAIDTLHSNTDSMLEKSLNSNVAQYVVDRNCDTLLSILFTEFMPTRRTQLLSSKSRRIKDL